MMLSLEKAGVLESKGGGGGGGGGAIIKSKALTRLGSIESLHHVLSTTGSPFFSFLSFFLSFFHNWLGDLVATVSVVSAGDPGFTPRLCHRN